MANKFGGFGGFGGGNMQAMMRQAQKMQQDALKAKEELDNTVFVGTASGEMVTVEINGAFEMQSVKIDPAVVDADDVDMLQDLLIGAINEVMRKIDEDAEQEMGKVSGGLSIPGMF
jgi:DNA-binding YbaB/EbfC family protein